MNNCNKIYIIAEAGVNHNGKKKQAMDMVDSAVAFGANAIKFQTFQADLLVTKTAPKATYQKSFFQSDKSQLSMLKDLELSNDDFKDIYDYCVFKKIDFLSTAFDSSSLSFLSNTLNINKFKIPSGELSNAPFILEHALLGKNLIVSTGMSTLKDIEIALGVIAFGLKNSKDKPSLKNFSAAYNSKSGKNMLRKSVTLLHCTTSYPAPTDEVNLKAMIGLKEKFKINVGFSDHTKGILAPIVASSLGANIIEKHFTLNKNQKGPDHKASIEPEEFKEMVNQIRLVEKLLGNKDKKIENSEIENQKVTKKSIVALKNIKIGDKFTSENIICKRPGYGISPLKYWEILEKKSKKSYRKDMLISE